MSGITRRKFVTGAFVVGTGVLLPGCKSPVPAPTPSAATAVPPTATAEPKSSPTPGAATAVSPTAIAALENTPTPAPPESAYLAVVRGVDPEAITERAIAAIGGMERFCKSGDDVIIKPNICNANHGPEYASTTHPTVVATLVKLALGAGAKRVRVMDAPFSGSPQSAYAMSGIGAAVEAAGGEMEIMRPRYVESDIPLGVDLKTWRFYQPVLDADLIINVPIAKHHSLAGLTLGAKNLMGVIENRPAMHRNLGQRIADVTSRVMPQLTVIDAVRMLMANGPTGGNLADVKQTDAVIASHDIVAADAYAATLFGKRPSEIAYIAAGEAMGLGTLDLDGVKLEELSL